MSRTVTFINDVSFTATDLAEPLRSLGFDVRILTRRRSLVDKTIRVVKNVLAAKGIVHVNYALQDSWLASLLNRLDVLHVHGSDVRLSLHRQWGGMVKTSLKKAAKVLVATPDILPAVRKLRADSIYLPTPVNTDLFSPSIRPEINLKVPVHETLPAQIKLRALYFARWYDPVPLELFEMLSRVGINVDSRSHLSAPRSAMPSLLSSYDIFIDQMTIPAHSKTALEAMSCGLCLIDYRFKKNLGSKVTEILDKEKRHRENLANRQYVIEHHDRYIIAKQLAEVYKEIDRK